MSDKTFIVARHSVSAWDAGTFKRLSDTQIKRSPLGFKITIAMHLLVRNQKLVSRYPTSHNLRPSQYCDSMLVSDVLGLSELPN
ncbi:hypothetical protein P692DRAFT_20905012 [Suillus brevipes Sb2]|nr:hypothetical protein P692DRAFT_20905012 [Suillus brevipes Sb2]